MKKHFILLCFVVLAWIAKAQNVISSSAYIQTCIQKTNCFSVNNTSYLFYDESKEELILKLDFKKFKSGQDTIDDWMNDLNGSNLYFIAHINKGEFTALSNNNSKVIKNVSGSIYFNDIWQNTVTEVTIFQTSENSMLSRSTNDNAYDTFKVNFGFSFLPKDFKIHKRAHHLKKIITIGVAAGRVNQLKPEMQGLIQEINKK